MKTFKEFLIEGTQNKENMKMLDIHIPEVSKVIKSKSAIHSFLREESFIITEKTDGVKVSLFRNKEDFDSKDYSKNWIVAHKGFILYPFEHEGIDKDVIKNESIGNSQFAFVHEILKKAHSKLSFVPKNEEFFLEFLMNKPTLTRTYSPSEGLHQLILIAHSPSSFVIKQGKISSNPSSFIQDDSLAKQFTQATKIKPLQKIFEGTLLKDGKFNESGIVSDNLKKRFNEMKEEIDDVVKENENEDLIVSVLQTLFTTYHSSFGGSQIEGSVLKNSFSGKFYKFIAPGQYSKDFRSIKKENMEGTQKEKEKYFSLLEKEAENLFSSLNKQKDIETLLKEISKKIYSSDFSSSLPFSEKKTNLQKQDDLYLKVKTMILDSKDSSSEFYISSSIKNESNLGFFIGKIRIPTKAHFKIIERALKNNPEGLIVALVKTHKLSLSFQERKTILQKSFGKKVKIVEVSNANLKQVLFPFRNNVSILYCGEDASDDYREQLKTCNALWGTNISLDVFPRPEKNSISSSRVEQSIKNDDEKEFKSLTPEIVWPFFKKINIE